MGTDCIRERSSRLWPHPRAAPWNAARSLSTPLSAALSSSLRALSFFSHKCRLWHKWKNHHQICCHLMSVKTEISHSLLYRQLPLLSEFPFGIFYFVQPELHSWVFILFFKCNLNHYVTMIFYFWNFQHTMKKKLSATKAANMSFTEQEHLEQILGNHIRQRPVPTVFETWNWGEGKTKSK